MFENKVYNDGRLIVGKMSGIVEPQSFINGIFWQINSRNVGEVKEGCENIYLVQEKKKTANTHEPASSQ